MGNTTNLKLSADDVEQAGYRHKQHAQCYPSHIQRRGAKQGHQQGETDIHDQPDQEGWQRNGQAGPHARGNLAADAAPVVRVTEVKHKHACGFLPKDGVGEFIRTARCAIDQQRLVVTALLLPLFNRFRRDAFHAELHAGHVVRRIHHEEQREGEQVHPDKDG